MARRGSCHRSRAFSYEPPSHWHPHLVACCQRDRGGSLVSQSVWQRRRAGAMATKSSKGLKLRVTFDGNKYNVEVPADSSVGNLMRTLAPMTGIPQAGQRLIYKGTRSDRLLGLPGMPEALRPAPGAAGHGRRTSLVWRYANNLTVEPGPLAGKSLSDASRPLTFYKIKTGAKIMMLGQKVGWCLRRAAGRTLAGWLSGCLSGCWLSKQRPRS